MTNVTPIYPDTGQAAAVLSRAALKVALDATDRVIEKRPSVPIFSNVRLMACGDRLVVTGTDLDVYVEATVDCEAIDCRFDVTVPHALLRDIVRKSKAPMISLAALPLDAIEAMQPKVGADGEPIGRAETTTVTATLGGSNIVMQALPSSDFPVRQAPVEEHCFQMPAAVLAGSLDMVAFAMSKEETRYYLNGVYMHHTDTGGAGELVFVATDGHRLAKKTIVAPKRSADLPGVIIPSKTVEITRKLMAKERGEVFVSTEGTWIRLGFGDIIITSKLVDGTYPDYSRVIPQGGAHPASFNCETLAAAIGDVAAISAERGRAVKLNLSPDRCQLSVRSPDNGSSSAVIDCTSACEDFEIGFNAIYLKSFIDVVGEIGDEIELTFSDPGAPALLRGGSPSWTGVLMPMRV